MRDFIYVISFSAKSNPHQPWSFFLTLRSINNEPLIFWKHLVLCKAHNNKVMFFGCKTQKKCKILSALVT